MQVNIRVVEIFIRIGIKRIFLLVIIIVSAYWILVPPSIFRIIFTDYYLERSEALKTVLVSTITQNTGELVEDNIYIKNLGFYEIRIEPILKDKITKRYNLPKITSKIKGKFIINGASSSGIELNFDLDWSVTRIWQSLGIVNFPKDAPLNKKLLIQIRLKKIDNSFYETYESITFTIRRTPLMYYY